jgi:F420 biosynthesis protein FbiB-like protein
MTIPGGSFLEFLKARRSVRKFSDDLVNQQIIEHLLEAACQAPSAHNQQPWRFVVLTQNQVREKLAEEMATELRHDLVAQGVPAGEIERDVEQSIERIREAPAAILLCGDVSTVGEQFNPENQQREYLMMVQSVALAGGNMLLMAHAEGLAAVWLCAPLFAPVAVRRVVDLPMEWLPLALILVGYQKVKLEEKQKVNYRQVTRFQ